MHANDNREAQSITWRIQMIRESKSDNMENTSDSMKNTETKLTLYIKQNQIRAIILQFQ